MNATKRKALEKQAIINLEKLRCAVAKSHDVEGAHIEADEVLCDLLKQVGFTKVVEVYNKLEKWYA